MAQLYRKSAVERISTPEQLDKALTVTSPMSWIALAAVTVVILAVMGKIVRRINIEPVFKDMRGRVGGKDMLYDRFFLFHMFLLGIL